MTGVTLDTGALIALERRHLRIYRIIASTRRAGERITVPAAVIAEWWRGQKGRPARIVDAFHVEPMEESLARRAGEALAQMGTGPSVVDAIVMASAASRGDRVLTGDYADLARLQAVFPAVRLLAV
jgi:predicted nucleic acid-binding protein